MFYDPISSLPVVVFDVNCKGTNKFGWETLGNLPTLSYRNGSLIYNRANFSNRLCDTNE